MEARSIRLLGAVIAGMATVAIAGCMDSSSDSGGAVANPPPPAAAADPSVIPASAGASGAAFVSYVKTLPADEVAAEPNTFETGFTTPAEDGDEPTPAS